MSEGRQNSSHIENLTNDLQRVVNDFLSQSDLSSSRQLSRSHVNATFNSLKVRVPSRGSINWSNFWRRYNLHSVNKIIVVDRPFPLSQLRFIADNCPQLRTLYLLNCLPNTRMSIAGLIMISRGCPLLNDLAIANCPSIIADLPRFLRAGSLNGVIVRTFPNLKNIKLSGYSIKDQSIVRLVGTRWPEIVKLDLMNCFDLTNDAVEAIGAACRNLEILSLYNCRNISEKCLPALSGCPRLMKLDLGETNVGDVNGYYFNELATGCQKLSVVSLSNCDTMTDAGVIALAKCKELVDVDLHACERISDTGVKALAGCLRLEKLNLCSCEYVYGSAIIQIARTCPKLKELNLTRCRYLSNEAVVALGSCQRLETLILEECMRSDYENCNSYIEDSGIISLAACPTLTYLDISDNCELTDECIKALALAQDCRISTLDVRMIEVEDSSIRTEWQKLHRDAQAFFARVRASISGGERKRSMPSRAEDSKRPRINLVKTLASLRF